MTARKAAKKAVRTSTEERPKRARTRTRAGAPAPKPQPKPQPKTAVPEPSHLVVRTARPEVANAPQRRAKPRPPAAHVATIDPPLPAPPPPKPAPPKPAPPPPAPMWPEAAFDALYTQSASGLVRQVNLLTGNPGFARHAVRRAFDLAWQRWPEVAADPDPVGWVRAAAYEYALAPWQRWVPGHRTHRRAVARSRRGPERDNAVRAALLRLTPAQRQAILLYDGLGLDLPVAAAESEASTVTTASRITRARAALSAAVPELGEQAPARLSAILAAPEPEPKAGRRTAPAPPPAARVRGASERGVMRRTLGAVALTALIAGATGAALVVTYGRVGDQPHRARPTPVTAPPTATPKRGLPEAAPIGRAMTVRKHVAWPLRPPERPPVWPGELTDHYRALDKTPGPKPHRTKSTNHHR